MTEATRTPTKAEAKTLRSYAHWNQPMPAPEDEVAPLVEEGWMVITGPTAWAHTAYVEVTKAGWLALAP